MPDLHFGFELLHLARGPFVVAVDAAQAARAFRAGRLEGGELRKRRDGEGQRLTDRRLVDLATEHHSWIAGAYEGTSAWVHLSPELVHSVFHIEDGDGDEPSRTIGFSIRIGRKRIPNEALQELLDLMTRATEHLFGYFEAWESRKGLPLGEMRDIRPAT